MVYRYTDLYSILTDVDNALRKTHESLNKKLDNLRVFFCHEHEEVINAIGLIYHYKSSYPLGLTKPDFVTLLYMNKDTFPAFISKKYIYSFLNRLSHTGLLEFRLDGTFDVTTLGAEYLIRNQRN